VTKVSHNDRSHFVALLESWERNSW